MDGLVVIDIIEMEQVTTDISVKDKRVDGILYNMPVEMLW